MAKPKEIKTDINGKDGNGLKLEKIGPFFQVLMLCSQQSPKNLLWLALPIKIHLISLHSFTGAFCV